MRNLIRESSVLSRNLFIAPTIFLLQLIIFILFPNGTDAQNPKVLLEQSANGPADAPLSSPEWIKGHLGKTNSHYAPGSVIPYRAVVTNLPIGCPLQIRLSFVAVKNGKHATDFPTNYNQSTLEHINEFGNWEPVDPLAGLTGDFSGPTTIDFPLVTNYLLPGDQSTSQANNLYFLSQYGPQSLSAWNADLSNLAFVAFFNNGGGAVQQTFDVSFTATSSQVVFSWGGHIAYDTLIISQGQPVFGYFVGMTLGSGSSSAAGLTKCLSLTQAAAAGGGGDQSFSGGTGEITYSLSGGKPINPTSSNKSEAQREESPTIQKLMVFPNPSKGNTIVTLPSNLESFDIRLIDVSGKIIKRWSEYKNSRLELTGLKSGMYILNITSRTSRNTSVLKIIVLN